MQMYREYKHRVQVLMKDIKDMKDNFLHSNKYVGKEVSPVPNWEMDRASSFIKVPHEVKIAKEALQGVWLTHDNELKDLHYAAMIQSRKNALLNEDYDIVAGGDRLMDEKAAEFLRWNIDNMEMDLHGILDASMDAISKGFSIAEIVYELAPSGDWAGKYMVNKIKDKDQRYFRFVTDEYGNLDPFKGVQFVNKWSNPIESYDPDKFFIFTFQKRRDNWYGEGLGEKCMWYMYFKKTGIRAWNVRLQRFANPTVVAKHPPGISETAKDDLLDSVKRLTSQSNIMFPDGAEGNQYAIDLIEAKSGDGGYLDYIQYLDQAMSKRILGGTLTTDPGTRGARSLGNIHQKNLLQLARFDALQLQDAFNEQVINRLIAYNFPNAKPPRLQFRLLSNMDRKEWLETIVLCQQIGLKIPEHWAYDLLELKEPESGEEVLTPEENVRLGHRGNADTKPEPSENADNSPYSEWEENCDVEGVKNVMKGLINFGMENGAPVIKQIHANTLSKAQKKYFSREKFIIEENIEERLSVDVSSLRNILEPLCFKSWAWGALTMMEAIERQGHTFIRSDAVQPQFIQDYFSALTFEESVYDRVQSEIKNRSEDIAGLTKSSMQHIIGTNSREKLRRKCTYEEFTDTFIKCFDGYNSNSNQQLLDMIQNEVAKHFNEGRMAICVDTDASQYVGGLQFSGALGSVWPVSQIHISKIYDLKDPIWSEILPPNGPSDMSFIAPVPKVAFLDGGLNA